MPPQVSKVRGTDKWDYQRLAVSPLPNGKPSQSKWHIWLTAHNLYRLQTLDLLCTGFELLGQRVLAWRTQTLAIIHGVTIDFKKLIGHALGVDPVSYLMLSSPNCLLTAALTDGQCTPNKYLLDRLDQPLAMYVKTLSLKKENECGYQWYHFEILVARSKNTPSMDPTHTPLACWCYHPAQKNHIVVISTLPKVISQQALTLAQTANPVRRNNCTPCFPANISLLNNNAWIKIAHYAPRVKENWVSFTP